MVLHKLLQLWESNTMVHYSEYINQFFHIYSHDSVNVQQFIPHTLVFWNSYHDLSILGSFEIIFVELCRPAKLLIHEFDSQQDDKIIDHIFPCFVVSNLYFIICCEDDGCLFGESVVTIRNGGKLVA